MAGRGPSRGRGGSSGRGGRGSRGNRAYPPPQSLPPTQVSIPTPAANVTSVEDQIVDSQTKGEEAKLPDISELTLNQRLPNRPAFGVQGVKVTLKTNYFELDCKGGTKIFRYNIEVAPPVAGKKRTRIVDLLLSESRIASFAPGLASDFKATLLTSKPIETNTPIDVNYRAEGEEQSSPKAQVYHIVLQLTGEFTLSDLVDFLSSTNISASFGQESEMLQSLNIILGHHAKAQPASSIMSIGSNRHFALKSEATPAYDLRGALQALRGYMISTRASTARMLLNVQIKNAPVYKSVRLDGLVQEFGQEYGPDTIRLQTFLKRLTVQPLHLERKNTKSQAVLKVRTISALATKADGNGLQHPPRVTKFGAGATQVEFYLGTEPPKLKKKHASIQAPGYISVYDFFDKVHNITVNSRFPVVNVGNKANPVYYPVDVCQITPGQPARARLSPNQTAAMIRFAVRRPFENAKSIATDARDTLGLNINTTLTAFGLNVGQELITVHGRILASPIIRYKQDMKMEAKHGSWNIGGNKFSDPLKLQNWSVLWILSKTKRDPWNSSGAGLTESLQSLVGTLQNCGMTVTRPQLPGMQVMLPDDNAAIGAAIEQGFQSLLAKRPNLELVLVITPGKDESVYSSVKYLSDVVCGVRSICVQADNLAKNDNRLFTNMALKFNLKMGGTNQTLDPTKLGLIGGGKTMVVGIDVTHPSPGSSDSAPSVAGMVASIDSNLNQFPAILRVQQARKEMVEDLSEMFKTRLQLWVKRNTQLPDFIIVCRDGVSEGQYSIVIDEELPLLKTVCREMYPKNKQPALSIVVVGKRHNTRFYPTTEDRDKIDERSGNPRNGTVVDRGITQARNWDFYLQAHQAIQGTARPAHYFVVHDEIFQKRPLPPGRNTADVLEELIHNMCYTFGRATKAVSICPPAYYADLVCERARMYLRHLYSPDATPAASQTGSQGVVFDQQAAQRRVKIHDKVKDTMFYI